MPEISLRAYGKEIDELVERERLEEAIAHCRYILEAYPKHLETYRLLGKAYLEAKRYGDAADIFQRVLSAVPDDFVSHVGMAIVREDEGNLDAAIWHMKRAFETNPSNPAIQQEMKRLIGRRDGLEPHKVRLTRGALARMYAHGELYTQAIDELRSKLQEDADRPDLQVLLANMYWHTDQRSEATAIANQIFETLPYCVVANRILAASLQAKDRIEEAAVYHRRLANLDPYAAFVESALVDANSIEDNAVLLEKLDWVAGEPLPSGAPGQPGWAATLGMEMRESSDEEEEEAKPPQTGPLPSWLEPGEPPPFEAAAEGELRAEMGQQGSGEFDEGIGAELLDAEVEQEGVGEFDEEMGAEFLDQLEDAESVSKTDDSLFEAVEERPQVDESEFSPEEPSGEDDRHGPGALGVTAAAAGIAAGFMAGEDDEELEAEEEPADEVEIEPADFLTEDEAEPISELELDADEPPIAAAAAAGVAAGMFDQLDTEDLDDGEIPPDDFAPEELVAEPVDETGLEPDLETGPGAVEPAADSEIPEWMQEAGWTESTGEIEEGPVSFSDQELDALSEGQMVDSAADDEDEDLTPAELPDWIHDIAPEDEGETVGDESLPAWIGSDEPAEDEEPITEALDAGPEAEAAGVDGDGESFPAADPDTSELPTWITEEPPGATETIVTWLEDKEPDSDEEEEVTEISELPDWMRDTGPLEDELELESVEAEPVAGDEFEIGLDEPAGEFDASTEVEPTLDESGDEVVETMKPEPAPADEDWLSAVAAVAADEDAEEPELEADSTPDWLAEAMEGPSDEGGIDHGLGIAAAAAVGMVAGEGEDDEPEEGEPGQAVSEIAEEVPDLEDIPTSDAEQPATPVAIPDAETVSDESPPSEPEPVGDLSPGSAPDWLEEIGSRPQEPVETDTAEWLDGLEVDGEVAPSQEDSETPDWLRGLADEGTDAEASGAGAAPDWLREIGEPGSVAPEGEPAVAEEDQPPVAEAAGGAPDWLQGIGEGEDQPDYVRPQAEVEIEPEPDPVVEPEPVEEIEDDAPPAPVEEDSEVMEWLEDLAAKQTEAPEEDEIEAAAQVAAAAAPVLEDRDIPDEPEEGLEWLEQLADQRGMDVDVALPDQPQVSDEEAESEEAAPDWLDKMATQPIPEVDLEALEAATRGEEVSPDAETIKAKGPEVQAHMEEAATEEAEAEIEDTGGPSEVAPDDITIKARASDLQAEMEAAEAEAESAEESAPPDDEVPAWLIAAAGQVEEPEREAPTVEEAAPELEVPIEVPEEEQPVAELEEPAVETPVAEEPEAELQEPVVEPPFALEPEAAPEEPVVEPPIALEPEAAPEEPVVEAPIALEPEAETPVAEEPEPEESPPAIEAEEPEAEEPIVEEPAAIPATQPADSEMEISEEPSTADEVPAIEDEAKEADAPAREVDQLEQSRQALAAGETESALEMYGELIKRKESLDSVIEDLRLAADRSPDNADLWQVLGDAYMRDDQTDEAIDAYRKGMEAA